MDEKLLKELKEICETIHAKVHSSLRWAWDDRFDCVLMVFSEGQSKEVYNIMKNRFEQNWNSQSVEDAPEMIRYLVEQIFGIRHGQLLFTMNQQSMVVLFAAWWPWESGDNISLRIGMRPIPGSQFDIEELNKVICRWFEV